jgi:hypothetical protein
MAAFQDGPNQRNRAQSGYEPGEPQIKEEGKSALIISNFDAT